MIPLALLDPTVAGGGEIGVDLEGVERAIRGWCGRLDAALVTGADAAKGVERLATAIRLLEAAQAALAGRVDECHAQPATSRTTAEWLARQNGSSRAEAQRTLDTAARLSACPTTAAALASGELSLDQAAVVTSAATVDPSAERRLVEQARTHDLYETRAAADRVKQSARSFEEAAAREARLRRGRHWRTERGPEGHTEVRAAFVPADFARAKPVIDAFMKQRLDQARQAGEHEPFERYAADAVLAAICAAGQIPSSPPSGPSAAPDQLALPTSAPPAMEAPEVDWSVVVLIDGIALRRGWAAPGETCEVPGIGPVSVPWVRSLLPAAQVEMLIHDSVDIRAYATSTRHRPRPVELAVRVHDRDCNRPGCHHDVAELDHTRDFADTHHTCTYSLGGLCNHDHDAKTYRGGHLERHDPDWHWWPPGTDPAVDEAQTRAIGRHLTAWNLEHPPDAGGDPPTIAAR